MEPAVIIMMLSVFFLLLSITVGLYSLFCGLSAAGDVRRMRNSTALRTGESDDKDKKSPRPFHALRKPVLKSTARYGSSSSSCSRERVPSSDSWPWDLSESVLPSSDP